MSKRFVWEFLIELSGKKGEERERETKRRKNSSTIAIATIKTLVRYIGPTITIYTL